MLTQTADHAAVRSTQFGRSGGPHPHHRGCTAFLECVRVRVYVCSLLVYMCVCVRVSAWACARVFMWFVGNVRDE